MMKHKGRYVFIISALNTFCSQKLDGSLFATMPAYLCITRTATCPIPPLSLTDTVPTNPTFHNPSNKGFPYYPKEVFAIGRSNPKPQRILATRNLDFASRCLTEIPVTGRMRLESANTTV